MGSLPLEAWDGDAFNRKPHADYLTSSLCNQSRKLSQRNKGLTVALDAPWGAGKTFFVTHWMGDLRRIGHPVVYFDAWENDIGDAPSVALMAAVVDAMRKWQADHLDTDVKLLHQASELLEKSKRSLRRALVPAGKVLLRGALQKAAGVGLDDLIDAFSEDSNTEDTLTRSKKATGKVLDKLFDEDLASHQSRKDDLAAFRKVIHEHLVLVEEHAAKHTPLPMFIFIDELDRCRPSYAIKLLEEVKHIFGVVDVVYVVSTNLHQLQNSVRSLYGSEFDGAGYLRRLFDREYVLPVADNDEFASSLFDPEGPITTASTYSGLPSGNVDAPGFTSSWNLFVKAFNLDLRSQRQLAPLAEEVGTSLNGNGPIHALWLFFLCAAFQKERTFFEACAAHEYDKPQFRDRCQEVFVTDPLITWSARVDNGRGYHKQHTRLSVVLSEYSELSAIDEGAAHDRLQHKNRLAFPDQILYKLMEPLSNQWNPSKPRPLPTADYATLVRSAGFVVRSSEYDEE
jgi:hypothetical protein